MSDTPDAVVESEPETATDAGSPSLDSYAAALTERLGATGYTVEFDTVSTRCVSSSTVTIGSKRS